MQCHVVNCARSRAEIDALAVVVPEPSTWALAGLGALLLGIKLRRRGQAADAHTRP